MVENDFDAVIIGAGVIGGAIGYELAQRGWRTLNIDKGPVAGYGSTSASSAIIRFSYSTPTGVAAAWDGLHYWKNWAEYLDAPDESGYAELVQCGMVMFLTGEGGQDEVVKPLWDAIGVPYEDWTRDELLARMPMLDLGIDGPASRPENDEFWNEPSGEMVGALFSPEAGYINDPQLAAHNLQRAAEAKGGVFRYRTEVVGITTDSGRCVGVELSDGSSVSAKVVVNAAGPHSSNVNKLAGQHDKMNIGTMALRHETYHMSGPADSSFGESGSVTIDEDNGIYFRPQSGNHIMMGTTDPACDPHVVVDADDDLGELSVEGWEVNTLRINKRIPSLGVPLPHEKKGLVACYDKSDDWIPIYDRTDLDGFYVAIGTSGNQFKNAGVAGHMMAELIGAVENGHDHDADPLVVTARYTGHPLDMTAYRRNREIDTRSSMSVIG